MQRLLKREKKEQRGLLGFGLGVLGGGGNRKPGHLMIHFVQGLVYTVNHLRKREMRTKPGKSSLEFTSHAFLLIPFSQFV